MNSVVTSFLTKRLLKIQQHQDADPVLQLVKKYALEGWPTKRRVEAMVQPYLQFAGEFKVENGLLFKGCRLVILKSLQSDILEKKTHTTEQLSVENVLSNQYGGQVSLHSFSKRWRNVTFVQAIGRTLKRH